MPEYVLNRNYCLSTPDGVVVFTKGQPVYVTPNMEKHASSIGAARVDGVQVDVLEPEAESPPLLSDNEREAQLFAAFDLLVETNESKDFTGQGVPTSKAVERLSGVEAERSELVTLWAKYKERKAEQV